MYMISGEITGCSGCSWVHSNVEKKLPQAFLKDLPKMLCLLYKNQLMYTNNSVWRLESLYIVLIICVYKNHNMMICENLNLK